MAKALLILSDNSLRVVEPDKALRYYQILNGEVDEPTEDEASKVMHIKSIKLPPSYRPKGYQSAITSPMRKEPLKLDVRPVMDENSKPELFHPGIAQGKMASLPLGDQ